MSGYDVPTDRLISWLANYGSHYVYDVKEHLKLSFDPETDLQEYVLDIWYGDGRLHRVLSEDDIYKEIEWTEVFQWLVLA